MATYLLTWNPKRWDWPEDDYSEEVTATKKGNLFSKGWSCGKTKCIIPGDRIFLLRQNNERGIIGSGYATSEVYEDDHWGLSQTGKMANYVNYQSDTLLAVEQRLPIKQLEAANLGVSWNYILASGISVPEESAPDLENLWKRHLAKVGRITIKPIIYAEELPNRKYPEGATLQVLMNYYERNPKARTDCLAHYGPSCVVCGFAFADVYGELGENYIHVHHLRDLATIKRSHKVDPIKDLRPVCPNCHAMLHQTKPAMTIEKLRGIVKRHVDKA